MKKTVAGTLILIFGLFLSTASAVEVAWFGPEQYVRTNGKPDVYTEAFSARSGPAEIMVTNGDASGSDRISSAHILLNGVQIFGPRDFNRRVADLSAAIHLETKNTLKIELKSNHGDHHKNHKKPEHPHAGRFGHIFNWMYHAPGKLWAKCGFGSRHQPPVPDGPYLIITIFQDVPSPTASLSAEPQTMIVGQAATLKWSCSEAETCVIEPNIGVVDTTDRFLSHPPKPPLTRSRLSAREARPRQRQRFRSVPHRYRCKSQVPTKGNASPRIRSPSPVP
jgi:hypothetical protein